MSGGTVTLNFSTVTRNTATDAGGGIASATLGPPSVAKLTLNFSRVTDNSQTAGPASPNSLGGGGIASILGKVTLNVSQVSGNSAMGFVGGGIASGDYIDTPPSNPSSTLTLTAAVNGNSAPNAGGGGIQNLLGTATVNLSQVNGNTSLNGGGISSGNGNGGVPPGTSHLTVTNSQVNGNTATAPVPQPGPINGPPIARRHRERGRRGPGPHPGQQQHRQPHQRRRHREPRDDDPDQQPGEQETPRPVAALLLPAGESSAPRVCPDRRPPPSPSLTAG